MTNQEIAAIFLEIADLLDLEGEKFKPEAYRRAARTLEQLTEDATTLAKQGRIQEVHGIGEALAKKVEEYAETGKIAYLERLQARHPPGLLALMRLPGVGPRSTARFHTEFGIVSVEELAAALDSGRLEGARGIGPQRIRMLRAAIREGGSSRRTPLPVAQQEAEALIAALRGSGAPIDKIQYAGSLRRRRETVGDLDLVATSPDPAQVMERFVHLAGIREVRLSGETKTTVILNSGLQVDLRVVPPSAFGAALQYLTGSKDHNVHLRTLALQKGLSLNEYGVTREGRLIPTPTEEEVYAFAGLQYVPPEIRENLGEIELASRGKLPPLLSPPDIQGELHIHVAPETTLQGLAPWLQELRGRGMRYGGFVVGPEREDSAGVLALRERLPRESDGVGVWVGVETPWPGNDTPLEIPEGADFVVLRAPETREAEGRAWPATGARRAIVAHLDRVPSGEVDPLLARLGASKGPPVEIGVSDTGISLESRNVRRFMETGGSFTVSSVPKAPGDLGRLDLASGIAARGWVPPSAVLNARPEPFSDPAPRRGGPRAHDGPRVTAR